MKKNLIVTIVLALFFGILLQAIADESGYSDKQNDSPKVLYLEIIEVNEDNLKERLPIFYKKAMPQIRFDEKRKKILIVHPFRDKQRKYFKLADKVRQKEIKIVVKYITKFKGGREGGGVERIQLIEKIPNKIVTYKEYVTPYEYFDHGETFNFRSYTNLKIKLLYLSKKGSIVFNINSDRIKNKKVKVGIGQSETIDFCERKIQLSKYGDLKKIEDRYDYRLPEELVVKNIITIKNCGYVSIYEGGNNK